MNKTLYWFLAFSFFISCSNETVNETEYTEKEDQVNNYFVTIISTHDNLPECFISKDVTFEERLKEKYQTKSIQKLDTLVFLLNEKNQLIHLNSENNNFKKTLLISSGDTVFLHYNDKGKIYIERFEDQIQTTPISWEHRQHLPQNEQFRILDSLRNIFFEEVKMGSQSFVMPNLLNQDSWDIAFPEYLNLIGILYDSLIDSLFSTKTELNHIKGQLFYKEKVTELYHLLRLKNNDELYAKFFEKYLTPENFENRYFANVFSFYFLTKFVNNREIKLSEAYDTAFSEFNPEIIRFFKVSTINSMVSNKYPRHTIIEYLEKYQTEYNDFSPLENVLTEIDYGFESEPDLMLESYFGEQTSWEALKKQNQGKIVYVDFWASWCAPCIRSIPYSLQLKERFLDNEVVFIYLALNDNQKNWKDKSQELQILENNFLIKNHKRSEFINEHKLNAIPRYMIFDKSGKLISNNAPGPEQLETYDILKELTNQ